MANVITALRIVCSVLILTVHAESGWFMALYLLAGFTDLIDGTVARMRHEESAFGAKLDTWADICFCAAVMVKLVPVMHLPVYILLWTGAIACVKGWTVLLGYRRDHEFIAVHSWMNRMVGGMLFLYPMIRICLQITWYEPVLCLCASAAAVHEQYAVRTMKKE